MHTPHCLLTGVEFQDVYVVHVTPNCLTAALACIALLPLVCITAYRLERRLCTSGPGLASWFDVSMLFNVIDIHML